MGIHGCSRIQHKSSPLEFDFVVFLLEKIFEHAKHAGHTDRRRLKIAIDASLIGFQFLDRPHGAICGCQVLVQEFTKRCIDVVVVCDGPDRYHSKRATILRSSTRERGKIKASLKRIELAMLLRAEGEDPEKRKKLGREIAVGERAANRKLPENFSDRLKSFCEGYGTNGRGTVEFIEARLQADPVIAGLSIKSSIDGIVSENSDYHMLIGPGTPCADLLLTNVKIRNSTIESCCLATGQDFTKIFCEGILQERATAEYSGRRRLPIIRWHGRRRDARTRWSRAWL
jgi:hypothetical protein